MLILWVQICTMQQRNIAVRLATIVTCVRGGSGIPGPTKMTLVEYSSFATTAYKLRRSYENFLKSLINYCTYYVSIRVVELLKNLLRTMARFLKVLIPFVRPMMAFRSSGFPLCLRRISHSQTHHYILFLLVMRTAEWNPSPLRLRVMYIKKRPALIRLKTRSSLTRCASIFPRLSLTKKLMPGEWK